MEVPVPVVHLRRLVFVAFGAWLLLAALNAIAADAGKLTVGSKRFTESYILGEIVMQTAAPHPKRACGSARGRPCRS